MEQRTINPLRWARPATFSRHFYNFWNDCQQKAKIACFFCGSAKFEISCVFSVMRTFQPYIRLPNCEALTLTVSLTHTTLKFQLQLVLQVRIEKEALSSSRKSFPFDRKVFITVLLLLLKRGSLKIIVPEGLIIRKYIKITWWKMHAYDFHLLENSYQLFPRFPPGYEGTKIIIYVLYMIILFRVSKEEDDILSAYDFISFHETTNSHNFALWRKHNCRPIRTQILSELFYKKLCNA